MWYYVVSITGYCQLIYLRLFTLYIHLLYDIVLYTMHLKMKLVCTYSIITFLNFDQFKLKWQNCSRANLKQGDILTTCVCCLMKSDKEYSGVHNSTMSWTILNTQNTHVRLFVGLAIQFAFEEFLVLSWYDGVSFHTLTTHLIFLPTKNLRYFFQRPLSVYLRWLWGFGLAWVLGHFPAKYTRASIWWWNRDTLWSSSRATKRHYVFIA